MNRKSRDGIPTARCLYEKPHASLPTLTPLYVLYCIYLHLTSSLLPSWYVFLASVNIFYNVHVHVALLISTTATFFILLVPKTRTLPHLMGWHIALIVIGVLVLMAFIVIIITIIVVSCHQISELDLLHQNFF